MDHVSSGLAHKVTLHNCSIGVHRIELLQWWGSLKLPVGLKCTCSVTLSVALPYIALTASLSTLLS